MADRRGARGGQGGGRSARGLGTAFALALATLAAGLSATAQAGQVRINVGTPTNQFTPRIANLNLGDHAVWVWTNGSHTVTSGDSASVTADGLFGFDFAGLNIRYSWRSTQAGNLPYFCAPHAPGMAGRIVVSPSGAPVPIAVADFRITEVQFNVAGGADLIEIANLGMASGNLGRYRIATTVGTPTELPAPAATPNDIIVAAGARVVVHLNATGTNTNSDLYLPSFVPGTGLPDVNGSLALYVPQTVFPLNASSSADMMIDFVQWGAAGQANEGTAETAGFWTAGTAILGVAAGHSIEYCANPTLDHGVNRWAEIFPPNFGSNNDCLTPVVTESWGRLKTLYR